MTILRIQNAFRSIIFPCLFLLIQTCSDFTFNSVTVTLKGAKDIKNITGCFEPTEDLIKVSYIQIIGQQILIIKRDAIHSLPNLVDVILEDNNITDIEPGAFRNLTMLYLLKIKNGNIKAIRNGVFAYLPITELSLVNNTIEIIDPNAFDNMPNLVVVSLNENKITTISNWFKGSPMVSNLNLERNYISTIPGNIFKNIQGTHLIKNLTIHTNILLNDNMINKIEDGAFNGTETLGWLFLHRNEIEQISEESLGFLKSIDWVRLDHNRLECIPEKLVHLSPKVVYYLQGNHLSQICINKLNIKTMANLDLDNQNI